MRFLRHKHPALNLGWGMHQYQEVAGEGAVYRAQVGVALVVEEEVEVVEEAEVEVAVEMLS